MSTKKPFRLNKADIIFCIILIVLIIFLLFLLFLNSTGTELPLLKLTELGASVFDKQSPGDIIKEEDIQVYSDRVIIFVNHASVSRYAATKSMDPILDSSANGIEIPVTSIDQLHVGDIIAYEQDNNLIVHRIIKISQDEQGWFCITKGDNAPTDDGKVRFNQIKFLTIAIVY